MCHCDNQGVVAAVRGGYCKDPAMAHMLRCLFFREAKFGFSLSAVHVSEKDNGAADAISRNKLDTFFDQGSPSHMSSSSGSGGKAGGAGTLDIRRL